MLKFNEEAQLWFIDLNGPLNLGSVKMAFHVDDSHVANKVTSITGSDHAIFRSAYFGCPADDEHVIVMFDTKEQADKFATAYMLAV